MMEPKANKIARELTIHGDTRIDNYFWMRERDSEEVLAYLKAENAYCKEELKHTNVLQEELFKEIVGRIKEDDESVPYKNEGYWYYTRYEQGKEYALYCRKKGSLESEEEVILDVNQVAEGHAFCQVGGLSISSSKTILAYGVDHVSRRMYTVRFKNLETGEVLEDELHNTSGGVAWSSDDQMVFYTVKDEETLRSCKIFKHRMGTKQEEDELVFEEKDEAFISFVYKTKSKAYILIGSQSTVSTEYRYLKADDPDGEFQVFEPRERDHEYAVSHFEDKFYISTNWKAKNFRLMETNLEDTGRSHWQERIPHREDVLLEGVEIFKEHLVLDERSEGLTKLRVIHQHTQEEHYIDFGEPTYEAGIGTNPDFDTTVLRFNYSSLTTPGSVFDYDLNTREKELKKEQEVIGDFDKANYRCERIAARADDGTEVPVSLVYHKDTPRDGSAPALLYGYGSYGYSIDAYFSSVRLSLLDRGFVYAIAHIRGGEEMGRKWYEQGKLLNKKNTFTDFIRCGEHLIQQSYCASDKLFAMGGSAGGLLMGAVMNMAPDLWKGLVAAVPFVDVVSTMLDDTIPLTTGEYDEWGNPNEADYYAYIKSYSPYDNIENKAYPALLVTTGYHDSQVQYWEPAKWVAKLREMRTNKNPLLFHCNMETGHGGASGRFERYKETAMEYAFLLDLADKI